jgi:hypothetical protein
VESEEIMGTVKKLLASPTNSAFFLLAKRDIEESGGRTKWLSSGLLQRGAELERLQIG